MNNAIGAMLAALVLYATFIEIETLHEIATFSPLESYGLCYAIVFSVTALSAAYHVLKSWYSNRK